MDQGENRPSYEDELNAYASSLERETTVQVIVIMVKKLHIEIYIWIKGSESMLEVGELEPLLMIHQFSGIYYKMRKIMTQKNGN